MSFPITSKQQLKPLSLYRFEGFCGSLELNTLSPTGQKGDMVMSIHTFTIRFLSDGAYRVRSEWGRTRAQALRTIEGIYGKGTFVVVKG